MRLVTYDDGRVGKIVEDRVVELDVPDMRRYFELGGDVAETGASSALAEVTLRAPIIPKKFFHTAGNFREHHEESTRVNWSRPVLPWIVFFQNIDAIIGPEEPIIYPESMTNEIDYELELAVIIGKAGKFFSPEEAEEYIAGYIVFNDITARDIQREEMKSGVFCLSKSIGHRPDPGLPSRPPRQASGARGAHPRRTVRGDQRGRRSRPVPVVVTRRLHHRPGPVHRRRTHDRLAGNQRWERQCSADSRVAVSW